MTNMAEKLKSLRAQRALRQVGENLKTARLKRRMAIRDFASRVGVSDRTIMRLEKGDNGVSIGTLAMTCLVLGGIDRLNDLFDPASDGTGLLLERDSLPKRIVRRRNRASNRPASAGQEISTGGLSDDEGVGL